MTPDRYERERETQPEKENRGEIKRERERRRDENPPGKKEEKMVTFFGWAPVMHTERERARERMSG